VIFIFVRIHLFAEISSEKDWEHQIRAASVIGYCPRRKFNLPESQDSQLNDCHAPR
jgi:hypothetical protein